MNLSYYLIVYKLITHTLIYSTQVSSLKFGLHGEYTMRTGRQYFVKKR